MRIAIKLVAAVVVIVLGVFITGSLLPKEHEVSRSIILNQTQEDVWKVITDNEAMKEWCPDLKNVKKLENSKDGNDVWRFEDKSGHYMVIEDIKKEAPTHLTSRIVETDYPFGGDWIFTLEPVDEKETKLILTEKGVVKGPFSPFCRFMSHFIFGYDMGVKKHLESIGKKFGEDVEVKAE